MKSLALVVLLCSFTVAHAQSRLVHATESTSVYAEPSSQSKVVLIAAPSDELSASATLGDWTYVERAGSAGWIATERLDAAHAPAPVVTPQSAAPAEDEPPRRPPGKRFVNGFRLGWAYVANLDKPHADGMTLRERTGLRSPHMFLMGYELMFRALGHSWLNAIVVGNASVAGVEQSKFIPSLNGLVGVELDRSFQAAVGISLTPDTVAPSHLVLAAGWTPAVGSIQVPVHFLYIPDPDGNYRTAATVGMNW